MLWEQYRKKIQWEKFDKYRATIKVKDIVGGLPATPELIQAWVDARNKEKTAAERQQIAQAHIEELPSLAEDKAEEKTIVFPRVDGQLAIEGRQVKAMLKEAANIIKNALPKACGKDGKIAALKSKVAECVFVEEDYILLGRSAPDAVEERPISVLTRLGPRTSIKRTEICRGVEITFHLLRLRGGEVSEETLLAILDYAQTIGLGADRSQGRGRFEVISVDRVC